MKRSFVCLILLIMISSSFARAQTNREILFRDIPWRSSYTNVKKSLPEISFLPTSGKHIKTFSVDEIITNEGLAFDETDINIVYESFDAEIQVAGYTTSKITLYFAYVPINGQLSKSESDTALYAATYEFESTDLDAISSDLAQKLSTRYGVPNSINEAKNMWGTELKYTYWLGANDTGVVMTVHQPTVNTIFSSDSVLLTYYTRKGDEWLQAASDAEAYRIQQGKNTHADSDDLSGL